MFLEDIEMAFMEPCVAGKGVRMLARMSADISELMPYLNTVIKNATYNKDANTLCFTKEFRLIALYPEKIAMSKALNPTDAWQVVDWVKDTINETYENRDEIQPNYERHVGVTALEIFEWLPRLNCGNCGEPTCLAFAVKFLLDERKIAECKPLFTAEYSKLRKVALDIVSALGYEIPESYKLAQKDFSTYEVSS
jgi:ArsR family metal-binding transcriptional regulator